LLTNSFLWFAVIRKTTYPYLMIARSGEKAARFRTYRPHHLRWHDYEQSEADEKIEADQE
jgi:hypothetical protein